MIAEEAILWKTDVRDLGAVVSKDAVAEQEAMGVVDPAQGVVEWDNFIGHPVDQMGAIIVVLVRDRQELGLPPLTAVTATGPRRRGAEQPQLGVELECFRSPAYAQMRHDKPVAFAVAQQTDNR